MFVVDGNNLHACINKFQLNTCQVPRHAPTRRLNNELGVLPFKVLLYMHKTYLKCTVDDAGTLFSSQLDDSYVW
jgi:hypothetical protein